MTHSETETDGGTSWDDAFEYRYRNEIILVLGFAGLVLEIFGYIGAPIAGFALGLLYFEAKDGE